MFCFDSSSAVRSVCLVRLWLEPQPGEGRFFRPLGAPPLACVLVGEAMARARAGRGQILEPFGAARLGVLLGVVELVFARLFADVVVAIVVEAVDRVAVALLVDDL